MSYAQNEMANKNTGANAGGPRQVHLRMLSAARIAQFCRWHTI